MWVKTSTRIAVKKRIFLKTYGVSKNPAYISRVQLEERSIQTMQAIREYMTVKNRRIVLDLPETFDNLDVEVIVLPGDISAKSLKKTRHLGILKGKGEFKIRDDFEMTDKELLGYDIPD